MNRNASATLAALLFTPLIAAAQGWNVPPESQRCPSKWGSSDERGSGNHMRNPQVTLRAARLIKTGEVIELGHTYEITQSDLEQALAKQGNMRLQPGDAAIIHTGWGKLYGKDNARFVKTTPGIGVGAAEWLAKQDPSLVGSDNWPVEVAPNPDKDLSLPVHQIMLVVNGIHLLENMKLDELASKKV